MTRLPMAALAEIECSDAASSLQRRNTQTIDQRIDSAAGLGQIEAAGVGDGQRHQSADAVSALPQISQTFPLSLDTMSTVMFSFSSV